MGQRPTGKAGLPKTRHKDPALQRSLDSIVERLEVLDGIRGDTLDQAVTLRTLNDSGFSIYAKGGGGFGVGGTPTVDGGGGTDVPTTGAADPPTNLVAAETFLALLLTWDNPTTNLQHVEVHRAATDNLSLATLIGTSVAPLYVDYVGASATYYYWVRSVGTDGTLSAFNDVNGTLGTTGLDPSDFEPNLNISASNLDATLAARIDLIDVDGALDSLMNRMAAAQGDILAVDGRTTTLETNYTGLTSDVAGNTSGINANASSIATNTTSITGTVVPPGSWGANHLASITANSQSILALEASVGAIDSEGGQNWEFTTDEEGFTVSNATLTTGAGTIIFTPSGSDPQLLSPAMTPTITGGIFTQVIVRVKQDIAGGTWEGSLKYATAGHGISGSYVKTIPDPALALGEWTTLTFDMSDLTTGGSDWVDNQITQIQLDLVSDAGGKFIIDWIQIAKFSTSAISEAISALDVRVTTNEDGLTAQGTRVTALEATVDDPTSGLVATAAALTALTVDVVSNDGDIATNAAAITALDVKVYDPTLGAVAQSTAFSQLSADVAVIDGEATATASSLTQLVARVGSGYTSMTNSLNEASENYGSSYSVAELQAYSIGDRAGAAARVDSTGNTLDYVYRQDGGRIYINPNGIYEIKFSVYHNRPTDEGTFFAGLSAYVGTSGGAAAVVQQINNRIGGTNNSDPYWLSYSGTFKDEEWLDVTCYILGSNVDASLCPNMLINGSSDVTGYDTFYDGLKIIGSPYVELRFLNYNVSPTYGDGSETTTYVTDLVVHRIDSAANEYAAIQVQSDVIASDVGDLSALYAVKTELTVGGVPYVSGFGIASDVINGTATSAFGVRADQFFMTGAGWVAPTDDAERTYPFTIDVVEGVGAQVGIRGELIVDGTIRAASIVAGSLGADQIDVVNLNAALADVGILTGGIMRTAVEPAWRVELEDVASTGFPLWYGQGTKSAANGRLYVQTNAGGHSALVVKGLLDAGMIKQSYFAPAGSNQSFRVATEYPNEYTGGNYTGKKAHINTLQHMNFYSASNFGTSLFQGGSYTDYYTNTVSFKGPFEGSDEEFARLGSYSEMLLIDIAGQIELAMTGFGSARTHKIFLQYQYDTEGWIDAYYLPFRVTSAVGSSLINHVSAYHSQVFVSRNGAWSTLSFRLHAQAAASEPSANQVALVSAALKVSTPNFGYADASVVDRTGTALRVDQLTQVGLWE